MKIYTKSGDHGETSLFGGQRVSKNHSRIDAYGTVDELNTIIGIARTADPVPEIEQLLDQLQNELFVLGADLATPPEKSSRVQRVGNDQVSLLEESIDRLEKSLEPLTSFILPGGSSCSAYLHHARTVCRRAERICFSCKQSEIISQEALIFLNRLSDLLFVMARFQNKAKRIDDVKWQAP
ncbi:cob(I)yrinic acid a,c-diamide adenosyltransferase [Natronogracilivirga saccharolytica]|uniref:Corrinoid adenosyltransferase n=1 Tax=Natronogracilivirga saccharolytica TaxID=2812953 RepID=A0A8J7RP39_9BACT|nr:cob(I)yrinic acid a,c-diamide adenosyltransferase [Natronogracilivirga saccharolytica]MBP3193593.1 cob(I)yrinic acid a,c-diamide adenosyltransferase [Natronogracilivirga saccharolytica]